MVTNHTDTGKKLKVETTSKEKYQQQQDFIIIDLIKVEQQQYLDQEIINIPMNPIIHIYFNKHHMLWEIIHDTYFTFITVS